MVMDYEDIDIGWAGPGVEQPEPIVPTPPKPSKLDDYLAKLAAEFAKAEAPKGRAPRIPTLNDALNSVGLAALGISWDAANAQEKKAIRDAYNILDRVAWNSYGKGYRYLSASEKESLHELVQDYPVPEEEEEVPTFRLTPSQNAILQAQRDRLQAGLTTPEEAIAAMMQAGLPQDMAQAIIEQETARETRRVKLIEERRLEAERTREAQRAMGERVRWEQRKEKAEVAQPSILPRMAQTRATPSLSWERLATVMSPRELQGMVSAWSQGGLGIDTISPIRLRRMMASMPFTNSPEEFLGTLRSAWAQSQPARQGTIRAGSVARPPRPVRIVMPTR